MTVRYQQRGLPPSTVAGPLTVDAHVADAIRVLDALGIDRAWAVGHSWGAHLAFHLAVARPDRQLGVIGIDPLGAVPDCGWGELDRKLSERLERHSEADAARAEEIDGRAIAGEATPEELRESLALVWPFCFAEPARAPAMPDIALSVELYASVAASVVEHFERGTLVSGLPRFQDPFFLIHATATRSQSGRAARRPSSCRMECSR